MLTGEFSSSCSIIIDFSSYFYFRRLVTNILLSFLTTSRGDPKRFEMLALLATILSWDDAEREKAGLQRQGAVGGGGKGKTIKGKDKESEKSAEEEAAMNEVSRSHQPATRFYWHICVELNLVPTVFQQLVCRVPPQRSFSGSTVSDRYIRSPASPNTVIPFSRLTSYIFAYPWSCSRIHVIFAPVFFA